jgi:hypothetical protein
MGHKYPILKPNEIISALSKKGFVYKSQKGSHAKYSDGHYFSQKALCTALATRNPDEGFLTESTINKTRYQYLLKI